MGTKLLCQWGTEIGDFREYLDLPLCSKAIEKELTSKIWNAQQSQERKTREEREEKSEGRRKAEANPEEAATHPMCALGTVQVIGTEDRNFAWRNFWRFLENEKWRKK